MTQDTENSTPTDDSGFDELQSLWQADDTNQTSVDYTALARRQGVIWWRMRILAFSEALIAIITAFVFFGFALTDKSAIIVGVWGGLVMLFAAAIPFVSRRGSWGRADGDLIAVLEAEKRHHVAAVRYYTLMTRLTIASLPLPLLAYWYLAEMNDPFEQKMIIVGVVYFALTVFLAIKPFFAQRWIASRNAKIDQLSSLIDEQKGG